MGSELGDKDIFYKFKAAEFKERTESDKQIVPIPEDLGEWFG